MDLSILQVLMIDGLTNGAVYGLLGLGIVLVFTVTRVIFIPQGDFVAYGALTLAIFQTGHVPGTVWLLLILAAIAAMMEAFGAWRKRGHATAAIWAGLKILPIPLFLCAVCAWAAPRQFPLWVQALLTICLITAYGPLVYRVAYESLAASSTLLLLIVSVGVHFATSGLGLIFFGAEGFRNPSFVDERFEFGSVTISGQGLVILASAAALIALLWLFFERSVYGKALRATAVNGLGARLMGIPTHVAGKITFGLAALIGALSGLLIGPTTTVYYDSGFLIGLKGFVAAVMAGLASYPGVMLSAHGVGIVEAIGSFEASAFKEVIVFTIVLPVLLWRSLKSSHLDEES